MIILDYDKKKHNQIIHACVLALKDGKAVVYPTDTCYGLAVDMANPKAIKKLMAIKGRDAAKHISVVAPSISYARTMGKWSKVALKLAKKFWPGPLTVVVPLPSAKDSIGIRYPKHKIAHDLAYKLGRPISATSANRSGQKDCYTLADILKNFREQNNKPDIIINDGRLPKRKPSTLVKVEGDQVAILRRGPITQKQIKNVL